MKTRFLIDFPAYAAVLLMCGLPWYLAISAAILGALFTCEREIEDRYHPIRASGEPEEARLEALPAFARSKEAREAHLRQMAHRR